MIFFCVCFYLFSPVRWLLLLRSKLSLIIIQRNLTVGFYITYTVEVSSLSNPEICSSPLHIGMSDHTWPSWAQYLIQGTIDGSAGVKEFLSHTFRKNLSLSLKKFTRAEFPNLVQSSWYRCVLFGQDKFYYNSSGYRYASADKFPCEHTNILDLFKTVELI
jgi:hypothetical protein